jgi:vancomycin resistance protein YoaR
MVNATMSKKKPGARAKASAPSRPASKAPVAAASRAPTLKMAAASAKASKEDLRARIEKLERANATLRVKNKELRLAHVESSEQVDALTLKIESLERRVQRQTRQDAVTVGGGRRGRSSSAGTRARGREAVSDSEAAAERPEEEGQEDLEPEEADAWVSLR